MPGKTKLTKQEQDAAKDFMKGAFGSETEEKKRAKKKQAESVAKPNRSILTRLIDLVN